MNMTLIQFRDAMREDYFSRNPQGHVGRKEYDRIYPPKSRYGYWFDSIQDAVKAGAVIRREVCDDLYRRSPMAWKSLVHDFGTDWLPKGYFNPDVRKINRR